MKIVNKELREFSDLLEKAWLNGVREDYSEGHLWYKENAVSASLYHHLRVLLKESKIHSFIWFELPFKDIKDEGDGWIDIVIANPSIPVGIGSVLDNDDVVVDLLDGGLRVAIEVKYANEDYESDFKKLRKLQEMTEFEILPVFAYVGHSVPSRDASSQLEPLQEEVDVGDVLILFGDPHETKGWDTL